VLKAGLRQLWFLSGRAVHFCVSGPKRSLLSEALACVPLPVLRF